MLVSLVVCILIYTSQEGQCRHKSQLFHYPNFYRNHRYNHYWTSYYRHPFNGGGLRSYKYVAVPKNETLKETTSSVTEGKEEQKGRSFKKGKTGGKGGKKKKNTTSKAKGRSFKMPDFPEMNFPDMSEMMKMEMPDMNIFDNKFDMSMPDMSMNMDMFGTKKGSVGTISSSSKASDTIKSAGNPTTLKKTSPSKISDNNKMPAIKRPRTKNPQKTGSKKMEMSTNTGAKKVPSTRKKGQKKQFNKPVVSNIEIDDMIMPDMKMPDMEIPSFFSETGSKSKNEPMSSKSSSKPNDVVVNVVAKGDEDAVAFATDDGAGSASDMADMEKEMAKMQAEMDNMMG